MNKQALLEQWLLDGNTITHWEAVRKWRMLDFRKAISRIGEAIYIERRWCERDGIRFREYWIPKKSVQTLIAKYKSAGKL